MRNYLGLIETTVLGPIPFGDWTPAFQFAGYDADGETNEFPWVGDKIVIWDQNTHNIIWEWDKGHAGDTYNEKADFLARRYIEEN